MVGSAFPSCIGPWSGYNNSTSDLLPASIPSKSPTANGSHRIGEYSKIGHDTPRSEERIKLSLHFVSSNGDRQYLH